MKGDFSRLTFDKKKHYSGVLMQQGRVLLDADWNEQQALNRYRIDTETADTIGPCGAPLDEGLRIEPHSSAKALSVVFDKPTEKISGWVVGEKASILYSDGTDIKAQEAPQGLQHDLAAVHFINAKCGWAVGAKGTLIQTADGGESWKKQSTNIKTDLNAVYFLNEKIGCAVGERGVLLFTVDGGKTWSKESKTAVRLNAVHLQMITKDAKVRIFAVGDQATILQYTWNTRRNQLVFDPMPAMPENMQDKPDFYAVNSTYIGRVEQVCAVGENGTIFMKTDRSWNKEECGLTQPLKAILALRTSADENGDIPYTWAAVAADGTVVFQETSALWQTVNVKLPASVGAVNFIDYQCDAPHTLTFVLDSAGRVYRLDQSAWRWVMTTQLIDGLSASVGRIYVDGILCQLDEPYAVPLPTSQGVSLIYLDVWRRHLTALQDNALRETALAGPDTTTRVQTVAQVKILPLLKVDIAGKIGSLRALAERITRTIAAGAVDVTQDVQLSKAAAELSTFVDLGHAEVLTRLRQAMQKASPALKLKKAARTSKALENLKTQVVDWYELHDDIIRGVRQKDPCALWDELIAPSTCLLKADVKPPDAPTTACALGASGGYQGLENQLYRVEIHLGSADGGHPTFKWSRDNGSITFPFEIISTDETQTTVGLTTQDLGSYYPMTKEEWIGAWVEVINDDIELGGQSGSLHQVLDVPSENRMVLKGALDATLLSDRGKHPILRRWDQQSEDLIDGALAVREADWIELEAGVRVWFEKGGTYSSGDYWMIPARSLTGEVEWPRSDGAPMALPPRGIRHHYARLAVVTAKAIGRKQTIITELHDCEPVFKPLAAHSLHVVGLNWRNDSTLQNLAGLKGLMKSGLQIILDDAPDAWTVNTSSLIVTLDIFTETATVLSLILPGEVSVARNVITWRWRMQTAQATTALTNKASLTHMTLFPGLAFEINPDYLFRLRITLKGGLIWRSGCDQRSYLDGRALGLPRYEQDANGETLTKYDLTFPTGAGEKASDFESWLYVKLTGNWF